MALSVQFASATTNQDGTLLPESEGNPILTAGDVRMTAVTRLKPLLPEPIEGYRVSNEMVLDALTYAAADDTGLHGSCTSLAGIADDNTLRDYINEAFPADGAINSASASNLAARSVRVQSDARTPAFDMSGSWPAVQEMW